MYTRWKKLNGTHLKGLIEHTPQTNYNIVCYHPKDNLIREQYNNKFNDNVTVCSGEQRGDIFVSIVI